MTIEQPTDSIVEFGTEEAGSARPLIVAIDGAVEAQRALEQRLRQRFGTNNTDFRALLVVFRLRRRGQAVHPGDLTRGLGITSGAATRIISRLTTAGLIERQADPHDARSGLLTLSATASRQLAESTETVQDDLDRIMDSISEAEESRLIALLQQVREAFDEQPPPSPATPA